jgi:hypothetical protein
VPASLDRTRLVVGQGDRRRLGPTEGDRAMGARWKAMKLSRLEDQVTPARSSASDTAIACGVAVGPTLTCRL